MKSNFINTANLAKGKSRIYLFTGVMALAILSACNSKSSSNTGNTTVQNDTSSAVTERVDTTPAVHDNVAKKP